MSKRNKHGRSQKLNASDRAERAERNKRRARPMFTFRDLNGHKVRVPILGEKRDD